MEVECSQLMFLNTLCQKGTFLSEINLHYVLLDPVRKPAPASPHVWECRSFNIGIISLYWRRYSFYDFLSFWYKYSNAMLIENTSMLYLCLVQCKSKTTYLIFTKLYVIRAFFVKLRCVYSKIAPPCLKQKDLNKKCEIHK